MENKYTNKKDINYVLGSSCKLHETKFSLTCYCLYGLSLLCTLHTNPSISWKSNFDHDFHIWYYKTTQNSSFCEPNCEL